MDIDTCRICIFAEYRGAEAIIYANYVKTSLGEVWELHRWEGIDENGIGGNGIGGNGIGGNGIVGVDGIWVWNITAWAE